MNKAFVREPDEPQDCCPHCGSEGQRVELETVRAHVDACHELSVGGVICFCPSEQCQIVYFDTLGRQVSVSQLRHAVYPKDTTAPICACFGLTCEDIRLDVEEGAPRRTRANVERSKTDEAFCHTAAANGRSCVAYVQKYYLVCLGKTDSQ